MTLCQNPAHYTVSELEEKCSKYGKSFIQVPKPIFIKLTPALQLCKKISSAEFHDKLTGSFVASSRSQGDKQTDD